MRTERTGMTLVELLIALVLALVVVGAIVNTLTRQQRLYAAIDDALQVAPRQLDVATVLAPDLRTMYLAAPAIGFASDSTIDVDAIVGASTICLTPSANTLVLPPRNSDFTNTLTSWNTLPDSNDALLIYHETAGSLPAEWERITIADIATRAITGCLPATVPPVDAVLYTAGPTYAVTLAATPKRGAHAGTPVRFVRHTRYSIYRASDAAWYIGARRCSARTGSCETVQPLAGPFPAGTTPPIAFRYFTGGGIQIPANSRLDGLARIDVILRRPAAPLSHLLGASQPQDSTITSIALRNRP